MSDWVMQAYSFNLVSGRTHGSLCFSYGGQIQAAVLFNGKFITTNYQSSNVIQSLDQDGSGVPSGGFGTVNGYADWDDTWKFQTTTDDYFLFTHNGLVMAFIDSSGNVWASRDGKPGIQSSPPVITPSNAVQYSVADATGLLIKTETVSEPGGGTVLLETSVALGTASGGPSYPNPDLQWKTSTYGQGQHALSPGYLTLGTSDPSVPTTFGSFKYSPRDFGNSNWEMGYGQNDWLGFTYNGALMMAITTDGRIWGKAVGGFFALKSL